MSVVYDAGVLVAADRNDRETWAQHRVRLEIGVVPVTTAPVVAQVSRTSRQVQLRRLLRGCDIAAFSPAQAHVVGGLLGRSATSDVVDGHVVVTAGELRATVLTADPDDIERLAIHHDRPVRLRRI